MSGENLLATMTYRLHCDTCDFESTTEEKATAYAAARNHESEFPRHNVMIERHS
jgi:hypothetical protein